MLEAEELTRRIKAARLLRGIEQTELAEKLTADGLGKHDLGRIERGDMTMQRVHRDAIARHLGVPERWLTDPDVDLIVGLRDPAAGDLDPASLRGLLEQALERIDQVDAQAVPGAKKAPADRGRKG